MTDRILVTYASWAGSTAEVAEAIAKELGAASGSVLVRPARDVADVEPYSAVVLGAAVHAGRLHRDAIAFVDRHRAALAGIPVAYFVVCLTMKEDTPEHRRTSEGFLNALREGFPEIRPVAVGLFGGAVRSDETSLGKLPLAQRLMVRMMKKAAGDFRDWDAIGRWARELAAALARGKGAGA
jgi:menaquinone-dependent protoporphyrinogen oxidase